MSENTVILVFIEFPDTSHYQEDLAEFQDLARATGAEISAVVTGKSRVPSAKYFIGKGKSEEIRDLVVLHQAPLVIFNHDLSPAQERNLESLFECRVLDRTGLILDIFAQRAHSFEGRLQVELAQLQHMATRLVRGWTHLERQKGGIGLRGPGETQLEVDRRLVNNKIHTIKQRLNKVRKQREQGRQARHKAEIPTISLVGYTNAGKSTLFNKLTAADVYVADKLFATLDPTLRRVDIPEVGNAILIDTVGFVRNLPHDLVEAFRATLEETLNADLLLHIVDSSDPNRREKITAVDDVLQDIGAAEIPLLLVYNKIDLTPNTEPGITFADNLPTRVHISAQNKLGFEELLQAIKLLLGSDISEYSLVLSPEQGKLRAQLYQHGTIIHEEVDADGNWHITVRIKQSEYARLTKKP